MEGLWSKEKPQNLRLKNLSKTECVCMCVFVTRREGNTSEQDLLYSLRLFLAASYVKVHTRSHPHTHTPTHNGQQWLWHSGPRRLESLICVLSSLSTQTHLLNSDFTNTALWDKNTRHTMNMLWHLLEQQTTVACVGRGVGVVSKWFRGLSLYKYAAKSKSCFKSFCLFFFPHVFSHFFLP